MDWKKSAYTFHREHAHAMDAGEREAKSRTTRVRVRVRVVEQHPIFSDRQRSSDKRRCRPSMGVKDRPEKNVATKQQGKVAHRWATNTVENSDNMDEICPSMGAELFAPVAEVKG